MSGLPEAAFDGMGFDSDGWTGAAFAVGAVLCGAADLTGFTAFGAAAFAEPATFAEPPAFAPAFAPDLPGIGLAGAGLDATSAGFLAGADFFTAGAGFFGAGAAFFAAGADFFAEATGFLAAGFLAAVLGAGVLLK
jgi:hypothetical protein